MPALRTRCWTQTVSRVWVRGAQPGWEVGEQTPAGGHSVRWGSEMKGAKRALGDATEVEGWTLLVAQWLRLCDPRTRAWVPSLVEELRAGTLCGTAKKKKVEGWNE